MKKNYVYRMDHDTGFAPNTNFGICSLTGCKNNKTGKRRNIEELAEQGSWVIGIGGKGTTKPDKLIYAMEVEGNLKVNQFRRKFPVKSKYLNNNVPGSNVLLSSKFYYFGENAIDVPSELKNIIIDRQGFWTVCEKDVMKLENYLSSRFEYGVHGKPNNSENGDKCKKC